MISRFKNNIDIILVSLIIGVLTGFSKIANGIGKDWYRILNLPPLTPPDWVFGVVWTVLYLASACAVVFLVRTYKHTAYYRWIIILFSLLALLNLLWSYLFFMHHTLAGALVNCIVIEFILITIIALTWQDARLCALLMLPSAVWVAFAVYINYQVLLLN